MGKDVKEHNKSLLAVLNDNQYGNLFAVQTSYLPVVALKLHLTYIVKREAGVNKL